MKFLKDVSNSNRGANYTFLGKNTCDPSDTRSPHAISIPIPHSIPLTLPFLGHIELVRKKKLCSRRIPITDAIMLNSTLCKRICEIFISSPEEQTSSWPNVKNVFSDKGCMQHPSAAYRGAVHTRTQSAKIIPKTQMASISTTQKRRQVEDSSNADAGIDNKENLRVLFSQDGHA